MIFVLLLKTFTNSSSYKMYFSLVLQKSVLIKRWIFYIVILQLVVCLFKEKYIIIWISVSQRDWTNIIVSFPQSSSAFIHTHTSMHVYIYTLQEDGSFPTGRGNVLVDICVISTHIFLDFNNNDDRVPHSFVLKKCLRIFKCTLLYWVKVKIHSSKWMFILLAVSCVRKFI